MTDLANHSDTRDVAANDDATAYRVALAWLRQHSDVTHPSPGTASVDHLEENAAASHLDSTADEMARPTGRPAVQ